jgi:hypothetical protein
LRASGRQRTNFPESREYRVLLLDRKPLASRYYWSPEDPLGPLDAAERTTMLGLAAKAAARLDARFVCVDVGQLADGSFCVVEVGDAQHTALAQFPAHALWTALAEATPRVHTTETCPTVWWIGSLGIRPRVTLAVVLVGLVACAFVWSLLDATRHPGRYRRLYDERRWRRAELWIWAITLAAVIGAALAGASLDALGAIVVIGGCAGLVCWRFELAAWSDRVFRDWFGR